jgi:hypothetical protein
MPCGDEKIIINSLFLWCKINIKNSRGFVKKISIYAVLHIKIISLPMKNASSQGCFTLKMKT